MKRTALIAVLALAIVGSGYGLASAHNTYGWNHMGDDYGRMGYRGGMMDFDAPGYGGGQGYCGNVDTEARKLDLTEKDAQEIITNRITRSNPNLKVGKVKGTEDGFEVQVVTRKGEALVDRLLVEKDTGRIYRVLE
ncbi:MAG: hypothetical protein P1S46_04700 [bacterium]|nr:hypothetical protein [bacterium]